MANEKRVLYLIICAAPPAQHIHDFIMLAQATEWTVCVVATPQATKFIDISLLTHLTEYPVRSDYKLPGEEDSFPKAHALVVVPATFNSINKWAHGIADTLALSILCEGLGRDAPIVAVPYLKPDLAHHPVFAQSLTLLRQCGVRILYDPDTYPSPKMVPWECILQEISS